MDFVPMSAPIAAFVALGAGVLLTLSAVALLVFRLGPDDRRVHVGNIMLVVGAVIAFVGVGALAFHLTHATAEREATVRNQIQETYGWYIQDLSDLEDPMYRPDDPEAFGRAVVSPTLAVQLFWDGTQMVVRDVSECTPDSACAQG